MALPLFTLAVQPSVKQLRPVKHERRVHAKPIVACSQATEPVVMRRSANYKPNIWDFDFLMSLKSHYKEDTYKMKADKLKECVRHLISTRAGSDDMLEFIDAIQRLGVGYHYKEETKKALDNIYMNQDQWIRDDLYTASLRLRLLRQHGYDVSQDIFDSFIDKRGGLNLKQCHYDDAKGLLSLYEASYFGLEGEDFLDEAKAFTAKHLKEPKGYTDQTLARKIFHSLELPLHRRISRLESRWYIDTYETEENMIPALLDLAKLDYNIVQAEYQCEVANLTRWWAETGLHKIEFSRDRILEHYFWSLGMVPDPQFGHCRVDLAKATTFVTLIDDVYDVYSSLEELVLFTNAVERWEVNAIEQLPLYMKICHMALLNTNNNMAFEILKEQGYDITSNQKKVDEIARGDVPKSIQCYMHEADVSEEVARGHVKHLIDESWKKMNKALLGHYPFSEPFIGAALNIDRQAHCIYQYGDGHGIPDQETKDNLNLLVITPIPINNI